MATVRREIRIDADADVVWAIVGDSASMPRWFPAVEEVYVDGDRRTVRASSGFALPEQIVTNDPLLRRFQYRLTVPLVRDHLGTIDVIDLGDGTSLVVYGTDGEPGSVLLTIAGAAGAGLRNLKRLCESGDADAATSATEEV